MKQATALRPETDEDNNILLDTVIAAHYLALQLRRLPECDDFRGREATEFLAAALSEWARLVEEEIIAPRGFFDRPIQNGRN